jgi:ABC-2 type transport system ATP-binding protein
MPQRFGLYEDLSVAENLNLYADLQGVAKADRQSRFDELMHMTGMARFMDRLAGNLSGGMKQKLGLACTLIKTPRFLLLDEPTTGVDPLSRRELWQIVYQQVADTGMAVLVATSYLDEAERCDSVLLLHEGELLAQDTPASFSDALKDQVFHVSSETDTARQLQAKLNHHPKVLDALVENEQVRLISDEPLMDFAGAFDDIDKLRYESIKPRFEDAFIARLKRQQKTASMAEMQIDIAQADGETAIEVDGLLRQFGDFTAVDSISFEVKRGEIFGLLGANGAGKSTTFRMLCGLLPATSGHIAIAGQDLRKSPDSARGRIGYMAQKFSLYGQLSVRQNLRFFSSAYGLKGKTQSARIDWALRVFDLETYASSNADTLPLGFKQRLSFAAALMHEPDILFLDEPTSGVDPLARREFWDRTNRLAENGITVLVTTHFMEEANYCDRLVVMASGQILASGTPIEFRRQAATPDQPNPSMEDAFIHLLEQQQAAS